jgi:DNA-binding transcriptional LysR family regulator
MIDLHKLHHFVVLVRTGSFVRAAETLHMSQPALTRSLQALERQYRVQLVDRTPTGVVATATGRTLMDVAEELLQLAGIVEQNLAAESAGVRGAVRFGIGPNVGSVVLPRLLRTMARRYPEVSLRVSVATVKSMVTQLTDGEIDFVIGGGDLRPQVERLTVEPLYLSRPGFDVRDDHPLVALQPVRLERLAGYPLLGPTAWNETLALAGTPAQREWLHATIELDNHEILVRTAKSTDAVCITTAQHAVGDGLVRLVIQDADALPIGGPVSLFLLRDRSLAPQAQLVIQLIRNIVKSRSANLTVTDGSPGIPDL